MWRHIASFLETFLCVVNPMATYVPEVSGTENIVIMFLVLKISLSSAHRSPCEPSPLVPLERRSRNIGLFRTFRFREALSTTSPGWNHHSAWGLRYG